jgi:retron-type reverse transcriptase
VCATKRKPYVISKWLVSRAYRLVKANAGAAGVDKETIETFENNLYKIVLFRHPNSLVSAL